MPQRVSPPSWGSGLRGGRAAERASSRPTITCVTSSQQGLPPADGKRTPRPASSPGRRVGPFWIEEPFWYWLAWGLTLALAVALLLLALGFDHP